MKNERQNRFVIRALIYQKSPAKTTACFYKFLWLSSKSLTLKGSDLVLKKMSQLEKRLNSILLLSLLLLAATFCVFPLQSDDLFMYLAMAKKYFELGHFPTTDIFLVNPLPWHMEHQWLSYFFFYGLYQLGGYLLISWTKLLLLVATMALPFFLLRKDVLSRMVGGVALILTCFAANYRFFERSELFSNLFTVAVVVICVLELQKPSRLKWFLPSLFALWVNLHPGFPLGLVIIGLAIVTCLLEKSWGQARTLSLCLLLCVLACLINPLGWQGLTYPFEFSMDYAPFLKKYYFEWFSPLSSIFISSVHFPFLLALESFTFVMLLKSSLLQNQRIWFQWLVFIVVSYFLMSGIRFAPLGCFVLMTLCLSVPLPSAIPRPKKALVLAMILLCLGLATKNFVLGYDSISGHRDVRFGVDGRVVPRAAVDWMKTHQMTGPIYNSHMFGAYLAWAWDGKYIYDGSITDPSYFLNEYADFARSEESFDRQAMKYQIQGILLDRFADSQPILNILAHHADWKLVYSDEGSLIFTRQH